MLRRALDRLAAVFFAALRAVAAITGRSLPVSVMILMTLVVIVSIALVRFVGMVPVVLIHALVLVMLVRIAQIAGAYSKAFEARDFAEVTRLREIIEGKGEPKSRAMRAMKRVGDGELLLQFEKWKEAADVLATVERDALPELARPGILSELGYARAHAGKVDKGVADIEGALEEAKSQSSYPAAKIFHLRRRYGIALSLAGEHERAVEVLGSLRDDFQGNAREWAEAFHYLGRSQVARGAKEEAARALVSAVVGDGPFVSRAWTELESILDPLELAELRESIAKERGERLEKRDEAN